MKKHSRKPRVDEIRVDFGRDQVLTGMSVSDDGILTFLGEGGAAVSPARIQVGKGYLRSNGNLKSLVRAESVPAKIHLDLNQSLSRFDFVFAVDTNTRTIGRALVSMTVPILIRNIAIKPPRWDAKVVAQDAFEFHDCTAEPEKVGWCEVIQRITADPRFGGAKIGVVVDSALGQLAGFNALKESVLGNFYLPSECELIYGCGDRGTQEFIANAAIAECDRISNMLLKRVEEGGSGGAYHVKFEAPYSRYRYWQAPA